MVTEIPACPWMLRYEWKPSRSAWQSLLEAQELVARPQGLSLIPDFLLSSLFLARMGDVPLVVGYEIARWLPFFAHAQEDVSPLIRAFFIEWATGTSEAAIRLRSLAGTLLVRQASTDDILATFARLFGDGLIRAVQMSEQFELTLLQGLDAASAQLWSNDSSQTIDLLARQVFAPTKTTGKAKPYQSTSMLSPDEILVRGLLPLACWRPDTMLPTAITPRSPKSLLSIWKTWRRSSSRRSIFQGFDKQESAARSTRLSATQSSPSDRADETIPHDLYELHIQKTMLQNQGYLNEALRSREEMDQFTLLEARASRQVLFDRMSILEVGDGVMDMIEARLAAQEKQSLRILSVPTLEVPDFPLLISLGQHQLPISRTASILPSLAGFSFVNPMAPDILKEIGRLLPTKYQAIFNHAVDLGIHSPSWILVGLDEQGEEAFDYSYHSERLQSQWQFEKGHFCPFGKCTYTVSGELDQACFECEMGGAKMANSFSMICQFASGVEQEIEVTETQEERTYLYNPGRRTRTEREKTRLVRVRRLEITSAKKKG